MASAAADSGGLVAAPTKFTVTVDELSDMMRMRGRQAARHVVATYGGSAGLCARLWVMPQLGLSSNDAEDIQQRIQVYGRNVIPPKMPKPYYELVWEAIGDTTLIVLLVSAAVSFIMSMVTQYAIPGARILELPAAEEPNVDWIEAVAILVTVLLVVNVTAGNDWSKERQFRSLQGRIESTHALSVLRDGVTGEIITSEILVGDILQVKYGDLLPADGIVLQSNDLKIDESSLTGETDQIVKSAEKDPILLSGTHVMEGSGKMVVTAIGINSQAGIIFKLLGATAAEKKDETVAPAGAAANAAGTVAPPPGTKPKTPPQPSHEEEEEDELGGKSILQAKLTKMALRIGMFGSIAATITGVVLILKFVIQQYGIDKMPAKGADVNTFVHFIIIAITVIVVAVPEGLPLAVTLSLAFSVKKMMKDNNLVRHLDACETMGNATAICSDKTGTLTTNRMTTVQLFACSQYFRKIPNATMLPTPYVALLNNSLAVNTAYTSRIIASESPGQLPQQAGNKTECALLGLILALGDDYNLIRSMNPETSFVKIFTFHSGRKAMATLTRCGPNRVRVHVKGASERIVQWCTHVLDKEGQPRTFDKTDGEHLIKNVIEPMASEGLRTLTMAYKDVLVPGKDQGGEDRMPNDDKIESSDTFFNIDGEGRQVKCSNWYDSEPRVFSGLTLLAVAGIEDPVRPEVPDAIRKCQDAGITVRMVTGDNINTARSIAYKCGILSGIDANNELVLEGPDFNTRVRDDKGRIRQHLIDAIWPNLRVLARSSPQDKYTLVKGIIDSRVNPMREVVAVTGDGTNDGPALKKADVGFAMGIAGTDVAKEASDIILTDDNFSSIVKAVVWGRNIYDSIAKFLQFQLTVNIVAVVVVMLSSFAFRDTPLKAVQMLWLNLIMDTLGSLALATEPPTDELLKRKPYGRSKALVSRTMLKSIVGHSTYQLIVILILMVWGPQLFDFTNENELPPSGLPQQHYTMVFNVFVLMTLCNQLNARRIHNERNVLGGIQNNPIYVIIVVGEFIAQVLVVEYGSIAFQTKRLNFDVWLWCIAIGLSPLLWHQFLATIPTSVIPTSFTLGASVPEHDENVEDILGYAVCPETQYRGSVSNMPLDGAAPGAGADSTAGGASSANRPDTNNNAASDSKRKSTGYGHPTDHHHHHHAAHGNGSLASAIASIPILGSFVHGTGQIRNTKRIHEQVHEMANIQENLARRMSPPLAFRRHVSDPDVKESLLSTAAGRHSRSELDPQHGDDLTKQQDLNQQQTAQNAAALASSVRSGKRPIIAASASATKVDNSNQPRNSPQPPPLIKAASQQAVASPAAPPDARKSPAVVQRHVTADVANSRQQQEPFRAMLPPTDDGTSRVNGPTTNAYREPLPPLNPTQLNDRLSPKTLTVGKTPSPGMLPPSNMSSLSGVANNNGNRDDDELVFSTVQEANSMRSVGNPVVGPWKNT